MPQSRHTIDPGRAALWASAFVIAAMVVLQVGRLPGNPAYAETVSSGRTYTLLTVDSGRGEDANPDEVLVVIDNRSETIAVYEVDTRNRALVPRDGGPLPVLFSRAVQR